MYRNKATIIGLFSFLTLFSFIPTAQAELWEFIVELNIEQVVIQSGDTVVITGKVVDHAYKATRGVEVLIRTGADTTKAFTNPEGTFRAEFKDFQRVPGTYTVNAVASWYGMTGLTSTQFQVEGDSSPISLLQQKLSTDEAIKYLSADESDFEKNPIGQTLFKYYHGLHDELIIEKKEAQEPNEEQLFVEQQRKIAEDIKKQTMEFYKPSAGIYDGYQYEDYIRSLNPEIQDIVKEQLNFTKNSFIKAQILRDEIIANGGTFEEARQAYLESISMPKETIEQFNEKHLDETPEVSEEEVSEE